MSRRNPRAAWRPIRHLRLLLPLIAAAAFAETVAGQRVQLQVLGGELSDERGGGGRGLTVAPSIAWAGEPGWLRLDGRATALEGGGSVLGAGAALRMVLGRWGPVEVASSAGAGVIAAGSGFRSLNAELAPGVWVRGDRGALGGGVRVRAASLRPRPAAPLGEPLPLRPADGSEVARAGGAWGEGRIELGALSFSVHARRSRVGDAVWREGEAAAALQLNRLTLSGFVGTRAGAEHGHWEGAGATLRVAPGVELAGRLARHPSDPLTGLPGGRTVALGITLSRGTLSGRPKSVPHGPVRVALRATPGSRVELIGDWNDWRPELVPHRGDGVYDVELHLQPGIYRFVFRVDGELIVPEGYETVPDDFGGRSAVVRVRG